MVRDGACRTVDPRSGNLIPLPKSFTTTEVAGFTFQCFGGGPESGDRADNIQLVAVIPDDAQTGDTTDVFIRSRSVGTAQNLPAIRASVVVAPMPDCNANGIDDAEDIAAGREQDDNRNGIPDRCDRAGHFSQDYALFLPVSMSN